LVYASRDENRIATVAKGWTRKGSQIIEAYVKVISDYGSTESFSFATIRLGKVGGRLASAG